MSLPKLKPVLYRNKKYKDGSHPIMIRITQDRKASYVSVGYSAPEYAWDEELSQVYEKKPQISKRQEGQLNFDKLFLLKERYKNAIILPNATVINAAIVDKMTSAASTSHKMKVNEESLDAKNIRTQIKHEGKGDRRKSFIVFADEYRDSFKENSYGTYKRYKTVLNKLKDYLKHKDLSFQNLTVDFMEKYQVHLQELGNNINTIHNNLKSIRAIYYAAIAKRIITAEKNPFFVFKLKSDNSVKKEKLTIDEIKAIEDLDYADNSLLKHCQQFFLFSFYCAGIRVSDMLLLKWKNIIKKERVEYRMEKTGTFKSIMLIPKAQSILEYYRKDKPKQDDFIFPFMEGVDEKDIKAFHNRISSNTALINKYLKTIAKDAEIEKVVSTHIARHSFSDIARKKKASIYDISKMLGHSSIKITEAYLASLDIDSQDETMTKILDF